MSRNWTGAVGAIVAVSGALAMPAGAGAMPRDAVPHGSLTASPDSVQTGQPVTFTASFIAPDSRITGYDWDFDGNGTVDRTTDQRTTQFAYGTPGSYTAKVAAKDRRGGAGTASTQVTVTQAPGGAPPAGAPAIELPKRGRHGRVRFTVTCPLECSLSAKMTLTQRTARRLHLRRRTLRRLSRELSAAEAHRITIRLPARARRAARRHGRKFATVVLSASATQSDHQDTDARRKVRVRFR